METADITEDRSESEKNEQNRLVYERPFRDVYSLGNLCYSGGGRMDFCQPRLEGRRISEPDETIQPRRLRSSGMGGCNIAWVDGHVSHVININRKDPYSSMPFQNGDSDMIGTANNYWDRD